MGTLLPSTNTTRGFRRSTVLLLMLSKVLLIVCLSCFSVVRPSRRYVRV